MKVVSKGRAMPDAVYKKNGEFIEIKAVDVNPKNKNTKEYFCKHCKIKVIHSQGNSNVNSKPFFRKAALVTHEEDCEYGKKTTLEEVIREIGSYENLHFKVKPPLVIQKQEEIAQSSEKRQQNIEVSKKTPAPIKTKVNTHKKHNRHMLTVDDLFHELSEINSIEDKLLRGKLLSRIYGEVFYPYSKYLLLKEDFEKGKFDNKEVYFFIAGWINKNEFINLKDEEKGYAVLLGKANTNVNVRIYPFDHDVSKRLQKITWQIKNSKKNSKYIGLKVSCRGIVLKDGITYIDLTAYESDINHYYEDK